MKRICCRDALLLGLVLSCLPIAGCARGDGTADGTAKPASRDTTLINQPPARRGAAPDDIAPPADDAAAPARGGLFDVLRNLVEQNPEVGDQVDLDELEQANAVFSSAKEQSRNALRAMNRQLRTGRNNSPNIILVVADALNRDDVGCYGQYSIPTPQIDALARGGVRFDNYYAGGRDHDDGRWSIMTGRCTGGPVSPGRLNPADRHTLPQVLWKANYATAMLGDCSLGTDPQELGFDTWFGYRQAGQAENSYPEQLFHNGRSVRLLGNADGARQVPAHDLLLAETLAYLDSRRGRPFFLLLAYPSFQPSDDGAQAGSIPAASRSPAQQRHAVAVRRLDRDLGRIRNRLKTRQLDGNTILIVTAATASRVETRLATGSSRRHRGEGGLYDGDLRVPLIVQGTRQVRGGLVRDDVCAACDLLPTLANLTQALQKPSRIDGRSLHRALGGGPPGGHRTLTWSLPDPYRSQAVRRGDWKAIRPANEETWQLYQLAEDPGEQRDLAAEQPEVLAELLDLIDSGKRLRR